MPWLRVTKIGFLVNLTRHEEALRAYDKAIELNSDHANAWYNLACARARAENKTEALMSLSKGVSIDPSLKAQAKRDEAFQCLWNDPDFVKITADVRKQ